MAITKNIIEAKQRKLEELRVKSSKALDIVTSTINQLSNVNEEIAANISEICEAKERLQLTEDDLNKTKEHNEKIIDKFRTLIED